MNKSIQRDSNFELLRIILMFLIVAGHYVFNSGLLWQMPHELGTADFLWLWAGWGKVAINSFVLITGYFMCTRGISIQKISRLIGDIVFYRIIIYIYLVFIGKEMFDMKTFLFSFIPIRSIDSDDFAGCFLCFYLLIPFLNVLLRNITILQHLSIIGLLVFIYSLLPCPISFLEFHVEFNYISWFCAIYLIASFVRLHSFPYRDSLMVWIVLFVFVVFLGLFSIIHNLNVHSWRPYKFLMDSNQVLALVIGFCCFMCFRNMRIGYIPWINYIASSTFAVYLIHVNSSAMVSWIWNDVFDVQSAFFSGDYRMHAIISVLLVFVTCVIVDKIRLMLCGNILSRIVERTIRRVSLVLQKL